MRRYVNQEHHRLLRRSWVVESIWSLRPRDGCSEDDVYDRIAGTCLVTLVREPPRVVTRYKKSDKQTTMDITGAFKVTVQYQPHDLVCTAYVLGTMFCSNGSSFVNCRMRPARHSDIVDVVTAKLLGASNALRL